MLAAIGLTSTAFGVSILSALLPLISIELFLVGAVLKGPELPWWLLALVVTVGQIGGKLLHYFAARGVLRLPRLLRRTSERKSHGRWSRRLKRFRERCHRRPVWTNGMLLFSAATSLPPYAATAVTAGWARIPLPAFILTGLAGRFARFTALILLPGTLTVWF
ncbi:membrane protein YqaA with SNARE-associated domain [Halopolyspora algeriensis]|uniref:Membrane protein YqaA with SNARE-associated domain n=1 Tax=Halopolyspora algeriensis TaxID=1500506 RepID=A0A368VJB0_9ACTN|nr:VTT domain-containing protein [Halopolyspora algeriensis]RCW39744.1 membrane protein YqaA with SNARE-associated domain [Halopolyspora algeriensis]TQM56399.1 membrane protein YqaA with SNARE-associated domain [Halopolyspora algeriensis]